MLPAIAVVICGYTIYKSIEPVPPHPIDEAPYIAGIWVVLGLLVLAVLRVRNPNQVRRFGEALAGSEAGGDANRSAPAVDAPTSTADP